MLGLLFHKNYVTDMTVTASSALFIYSLSGAVYINQIVENHYGVSIFPVTLEDFFKNSDKLLQDYSHVVVSAELNEIKQVMLRAVDTDITIGFLPTPGERKLNRCYNIPGDLQQALQLALTGDPSTIDLILCNESLLLFQGSIGKLPLFGVSQDKGKLALFWDSLKKLSSLKLQPFTLEKFGKQKTTIQTAATGCLMLSSQEKSLTSSIIDHDSASDDGMVALLVVAPFSILDYLKLMWFRLAQQARSGQMPPSVGYIKCPEVKIQFEESATVSIDGEKTEESSVHLRVLPGAVKVNIGEKNRKSLGKRQAAKERYSINSLPVGKEVQRAVNKRVPLFAFASEDRFRDLFTALRLDAKLSSTYIILMLLSTVLATVGLYLNSSSVIIGAMLLAPLMAPIISLAMSLLRYDRKLFKDSLTKIGVGILLALSASAFWSVISPYQPITPEMQGRLNPTLLDLVVAVAAGIAGAYAKSYKEVLENLAGVAIAVALVPPLAVAGIGLGRLDPTFFSNAFLLFLTNLVGIVLAATFTFRILGFSPLVRDKKTLALFLIFSALIAIPLSAAYKDIVYRAELEKGWKKERFLVNGKYLIIKDAVYNDFHEHNILTVNIHARDQINRKDLKELKRKIRQNFSDEIIIRANVTYIP